MAILVVTSALVLRVWRAALGMAFGIFWVILGDSFLNFHGGFHVATSGVHGSLPLAQV